MILGLGMDIVEVERIQQALSREHFKTRVFTLAERTYCDAHPQPASSFAARFAAKEAVSKALGTGIGAECGIDEIEILNEPSGAPKVLLHGKASATAKNLGINTWKISLTHTSTTAGAIVIGSQEPYKER